VPEAHLIGLAAPSGSIYAQGSLDR